jgi:hypothetical protein
MGDADRLPPGCIGDVADVFVEIGGRESSHRKLPQNPIIIDNMDILEFQGERSTVVQL